MSEQGPEYRVEFRIGFDDWMVWRGSVMIGMVMKSRKRPLFGGYSAGGVCVGWYRTVVDACEGVVDYYELMRGEIEL